METKKIIKFLYLQGDTDETSIYACGSCTHAIPYNSLERHAQLAHKADGMDIIDQVKDDAGA